MENYELSDDKAVLHGLDITLDNVDSPTFIAMRQRDFNMEMISTVKLTGSAGAVGGLTVLITENEHYDILLEKSESGCKAGTPCQDRRNKAPPERASHRRRLCKAHDKG